MRNVILLLALVATPLAAAASAPFTVGGHGFRSLQAAVDAIGDGEGTITVAPGVYRQCAIQTAGRVTFHAAEPGTAILERTTCEDKAGLVLRGRGSRVDGLVFRGYAVPDKNGAGIRTEQGDLLVTNSMFLDSEMGITGGARLPHGPRVSQRVTIDRSTFTGLGRCRPDQNCSHSVYLWTGTVTITNSRFEKGRGGHYVKLRAPVVAITDNSFDDSGGTDTSRMIDLPEGSTGMVARNSFTQGAHKDNASELIAVRAEFLTYPSAGLRIEGNTATLAPGQATRPTFVVDWSHERLMLGANRLEGGIRPFASK
jgi:hypothetical protein